MNTSNRKDFWLGFATLLGTIVGVGIFGVPYAMARSGFALGVFYLFILGIATVFIHLFYSEFVLRTNGKHRFVGYAEIYLGKWGGRVAAFATLFGLYGALLAYTIIAGDFLHVILGDFFGGTPFLYGVIFFIIAAVIIFLGLKLVAGGELLMAFFLVVIVALIFLKGLPHVSWNNLLSFSAKDLFLPYGVILFSFSGLTAIPELAVLIKNKKTVFKKVVAWGTAFPIIIYLLFTFTVVGVSGLNTSIDAIRGLEQALGGSIVFLGAIFGFLAVTTSFFVIGLNLKETFWYDYKLNHALSWFLTVLVPFFLFVAGVRNFIRVVDLVGAIMGGLSGILIVLIYWSAKKKGRRQPEFSLKKYSFLGAVLMVIFAIAIIYEIIFYLFV